MAEEKLDTTNKVIIPGDGNLSSKGTKEDLVKSLKDLTPEEMGMAAKELDDEKERREKEEERGAKERKKLESYRKVWMENIKEIDDESKQKIIKAAENIKVNIETDEDGSRLVEFEVGGKEWKILDPKLKMHSDVEYFDGTECTIITKRNEWVFLRGMKRDNVDNWRNNKLAEYVKQKEGEGLHIPKIEEIKDLLSELGSQAGLDKESDQVAMLMYLTGMDGDYRLSMGDNKRSNSQANTRSKLRCLGCSRGFDYVDSDDYIIASLCMIAYK